MHILTAFGMEKVTLQNLSVSVRTFKWFLSCPEEKGLIEAGISGFDMSCAGARFHLRYMTGS